VETHASPAEAEVGFFRHISVEGSKLYSEQGISIVVSKSFADERNVEMVQVLPDESGVCFAIKWKIDDERRGWYFVFHLSAGKDSERVRQLDKMRRFAEREVAADDLVCWGGDRNFTVSEEERVSTMRDTVWRPSRVMNVAWEQWQRSTRAEEVSQPEFTWRKIVGLNAASEGEPQPEPPHGGASGAESGYSAAVLDAVGVNCDLCFELDPSVKPVAVRVDLPHPQRSDHHPVAIEWRPRCSRRRNNTGGPESEKILRSRLPEWLFRDEQWQRYFDGVLAEWLPARAHGNAALVQFTDLVYEHARKFLKLYTIRATSVEHQLDVTAALLSRIERAPRVQPPEMLPFAGAEPEPEMPPSWAEVDFDKVQRALQAFPDLQQHVLFELDFHRPGRVFVDWRCCGALRATVRRLTDQAVRERIAETAEPRGDSATDSPWTYRYAESTIRSVKRLKNQQSRMSFTELLDPEMNAFTQNVDEQATIIQREVLKRQGSLDERAEPPADPSAGQDLLNAWSADFSTCRLHLDEDAIISIILKSGNGVEPGPDGVPGLCLKVYARVLAPIFAEAWDELQQPVTPDSPLPDCDHLLYKKWIVAAKVDNARTVDKLRDLEMGNEVRKVLARMLFQVLGEPASRTLSDAQQAFLEGREITRNTTKMLSAFWAAADAAQKDDRKDLFPALLLLVDCSKGYNNVDHGWLLRCLRHAKTPEPICRLVEALIRNSPILQMATEHGRKEFSPLTLLSGLTQGCPASCILYLIAVDPLLAAFERLYGAGVVSGFVDDWSAFLQGPVALSNALRLLDEFQRASGQRVNHEKTAVVPARPLNRAEQRACRAVWPSIKISLRERLLGVFVGPEATIDDQYESAFRKLDSSLALLEGVRENMSVATRIVIANVFLVSLFQYPNRHFYMPGEVVSRIKNQLLNFLTRTKFTKLGLLCHLSDIYGIRVQLRDVRLSNVASLLSTYETHEDMLTHVAAALETRNQQLSNMRLRSAAAVVGLQRPAESWDAAMGFYRLVTKETAQSTISRSRPKRGFIQRVLYAELLRGERRSWEMYLEGRLRARGWSADGFLVRLRALPRSISQAHRWHLLRFHVNGHMTSRRMHHRAGVGADLKPCPFCRLAEDSMQHLTSCPMLADVRGAISGLGHVPAGCFGLATLMLQRRLDGSLFGLVVAFYAAAWVVRRHCYRAGRSLVFAELVSLIRMIIEAPWLDCAMPEPTRADRRRQRVTPPAPVGNAAVYRSDGARRRFQTTGSFGIAYWRPGRSGAFELPVATFRDTIGDATSNIAEYSGLRGAMWRALRTSDRCVIFECDSLLVARQMARLHPWRCEVPELRALHLECIRVGERLTAEGVEWEVRHIYREFNQTSDALANFALDDPAGNGVWHFNPHGILS